MRRMCIYLVASPDGHNNMHVFNKVVNVQILIRLTVILNPAWKTFRKKALLSIGGHIWESIILSISEKT